MLLFSTLKKKSKTKNQKWLWWFIQCRV
jgi:hypothetical protein